MFGPKSQAAPNVRVLHLPQVSFTQRGAFFVLLMEWHGRLANSAGITACPRASADLHAHPIGREQVRPKTDDPAISAMTS